jgi:cytochrome c oxidase subunit III
LAVKHERLWHHFADLGQQREVNLLGMWVFLTSEVMVFGALFTGYAVYRNAYPHDFASASRHLNLLIAAINTVVLLTSSLTMALSVRAAQVGQRRALLTCLLLTAALGTTFMGLKAVEYYSDYLDELVPGLAFQPAEWTARGDDPRHVQLFLMFYYILTGLHAVHLTIGIAVLLVITGFAYRGTFSPEYYVPVEAWGLYWHFVDLVWIFLLPLLYLIGTHNWGDLHF